MKWKLFFIAQRQTGEEGEEFYTLGQYTVPKSKTVTLKTVGNTDCFIYVTTNDSHANDAYAMPEFIGVNSPTDVITRYTLGLSNSGTANELKYFLGAHWRYTDPDPEVGTYWKFGNIHDWEADGSLEPVYFGSFRKILGVDYD